MNQTLHFGAFTEARFIYICKMSYDEKIALRASDFFYNELLSIIDQCAFSELDYKIALLKKVKKKSIEEIAEELGINIKTCQKHCIFIRHKMIQTTVRMFAPIDDEFIDYDIPASAVDGIKRKGE